MSRRSEEFQAGGGEHFFHATGEELKPGSTLVPGREIGKQNWHEPLGHVYMSTDDHLAYLFGHGAEALNGQHRDINVYRVRPVGEISADPHAKHGTTYRAPRAVVESHHWSAPYGGSS